MRHNDPEIIDAMAQYYVLGLLSPRARRRFERLTDRMPEARERLNAWEAHLGGYADAVEPEAPPEEVWGRIAARLGFDGADAVRRDTVIRPWWAGAGLWQGIAAVLAIAAIIGAVYVTQLEPPLVEPDLFSFVSSAEDGDLWVVRVYRDRDLLVVRAIEVPPIPDLNDYQLWMLPGDGTNPVSLGLLPREGSIDLPLPAERYAVLESAAAIAVSLEPAGGSPEPVPTGPVLYTAPVVEL